MPKKQPRTEGETVAVESNTFLNDVLQGLQQDQKTLAPKYFYDARGSELFDEITALDEYYLTRTELQILQEAAKDLAGLLEGPIALVEFGSGSGLKVQTLLDQIEAINTWVPIEICAEHLEASCIELASRYPDLRIVPICGDYARVPSAIWQQHHIEEQRVVFFPGSTIGNLRAGERLDLLRQARSLVGEGGGMILGVDLVKDEETLLAAYDDADGVTAEFNKNILRRINRELKGNFEVANFEHEVRFCQDHKRIVMHLKSKKDHKVNLAGTQIAFESGETIHTECSHKFNLDTFGEECRKAGFEIRKNWQDSQHYFAVIFLSGI